MGINRKNLSKEKLEQTEKFLNQNKKILDIKNNTSNEIWENLWLNKEKLNNFDDENWKFEYSPLLYNGNVISWDLILKEDWKDLWMASFSVKDNFIRIDTLISFKKWSWTQLIKKLVQISESLWKWWHIEAIASPYSSTTWQKSYRKQLDNLLFYYKLWFVAKDPDLDRIIQEYIDKWEKIPLWLNRLTHIYLTNKWIQKLKKDKQVNAKKDQEYFDWKSHKYNITEQQARSNSLMMDDLLNKTNEKNKSENFQEIKEEISNQYKEQTWVSLDLTDEQILSIIDAHKQEWKLWNLSSVELLHKDRTLSKTIQDDKVRRFLFEAWFCGSRFSNLFKKKNKQENEEINEQAKTDWKYEIWQKVNVPRSDGSITYWAEILDFDEKSWRYKVSWEEDWIQCYKKLTSEELDKVNHITENYKVWQKVDIPRSDGSITHWAIIVFYDKDSLKYKVVWEGEDGEYRTKRLSKEKLDSVNKIDKD